MMLGSPYALPYAVSYPPALAAGPRDLRVSVTLAGQASDEAVETLDATMLPFLLLATSGALCGENIAPWTSTVEDWSEAQAQDSLVVWDLKGVAIDLRAWTVLAQMLLPDHESHPIVRIEISEPGQPHELMDMLMRSARSDPYPGRWSGIAFDVDLNRELTADFTVCVDFARALTDAEQQLALEGFHAWAPGLVCGAYGVAPVPPDRCTGMPDENILFLDNGQMEWVIRRFRAHTAAIEGLLNVIAAVSHTVMPVRDFHIE
jgi:hypothetical protein